MAFADLTARAQVHRLRSAARDALAQYPIEVTGLRLIVHAYNTSFRVDAADGRRFALRINVQSRRRREWTTAEMAWQEAIARDTDLWVPTPQHTRDGGLIARVPFEPLGETLTAVLYSWLPGGNLGDAITHQQLRQVGRSMAALHEHAERWRPPAGTDLPRFDDALFGLPDRLTGDDRSPLITDEQRTVLVAALADAQRHHVEMFANGTPIALHADLHQWNMKWWRGRLAIFDFDDSGFGLPVQDLAISAYYLRRLGADRERVLQEGYASVRSLPAFSDACYEANLATRNLVLLNDAVDTLNADTREMLATYVPTSVARLRSWLDSGVFSFDV